MDSEPRIITSDEFNSRVANYGYDMGQQIRARISMLTSKGKGELLKSFKARMRKYYGEIDKISYRFVQHGVFLHKGVGRGYAMVGGSVMRVSGSVSSHLKTTKRQMGREYQPKMISSLSISRSPVDWFNPVIDKGLEGLANLVADMRADQAVRSTIWFDRNKTIIK
jgi:hypothetical protein